MEANMLFYATFVAPVLIFLLGALGYTFLSWIIMCRKSRTTLKNKEHTRLANVRFDIRCSFIFLLLLSAVWISTYYYLRRAKVDDELAIIFGYLFVVFNTLMGLYIFVFHCIQNEKIRREYRKYVRQNSWLPKCLRCSKTSISSGIVGGSGGGCGGVGGTNSSTTAGSSSASSQMKKTKLQVGDTNENDETGGIISAAEDAIMTSSDCELNEGQTHRNNAGTAASASENNDNPSKSGIIPGSLLLQHGKANSIIDSIQGHIVLERGNGAGTSSGGAASVNNSMRAAGTVVGGLHTPSAGHTSPTSSVGSTHLIFGHGHKQQTAAGSGIGVGGNGINTAQEAYYHHPDYYQSWKQSNAKGAPVNVSNTRDYHGNGSSPQQPHEFFYWTQKHNQHGKKKRGSTVGPDSPSGSLHSRTTATSQQILFYPSYKKTTLKNHQQYPQQYPHYSEAIEPSAYYQQQHHRRHPSAAAAGHHLQLQHQYLQQQQQQQQQLSSDDEQMEPAAHAHLLHLGRRGGAQQLPPLPHAHQYQPTEFGDAHPKAHTQRYYRNKHSNCDLNQDYDPDNGSESYYNQGSLSGDGPVYEEILSNRNSDVQHYDVGDEDEEEYEREQNTRFGIGMGYGAGVGSASNISKHSGRRQRRRRNEVHNNDDDDEDDSVCDEEDDEEDVDVNHLSKIQSDERMRRLMAMQDEDFQRRFQRQQRKNGATDISTGAGVAYYDYDAQMKKNPSNAIFTNNGGGSVRSFKKTSPNNRLGAVNELFNHGPPLPPANQHPMQKRQHQQQQQQQQQQISPQSITSTSSTLSHPLTHTPQQQQPQQQHPIGRNLSAMLDENNTVRCYLEPLSK